ncbi:putative virulence factor [Pectobacterium polaris]|uniref:putative virulence factor n=1 Tax=Pectobacterium polaris TaxID=2042057 RepID=UPI002407056F|nr:virulence factor SrfC family protein [Pectobacterium polaris]MDG0803610.1 virulence factor SrfC family protein [Pectobacterium polaris]
MNNDQNTLQQGWAAIAQGCQDSLDWVDSVRTSSRRLDNEADKLNLSLLRTRNLANSLTRVSTTPMTVGFFGISQAGKSYLISALAAGSNGELEARYGSQMVDFIKEVNPVGGGKEATGLVTRFTRHSPDAPEGYPVPLRLFSEIDLAKILANTWFNDFNHEHLNYKIDENRIEERLRPFLQRAGQPSANNGVISEDVVALWDYLNASFKKSVEKLEHAWWPQVLKIAPALSPHERADLFSLLWGEQPELTETYRSLASVLTKLNHARMVFAPLQTLIDHSSGSIMNVDSLNRLHSTQDRTVEIRFWKENQQTGSATLFQAELAALTSELIFPLAEATSNSVMEQVDLLDFPGYRGRLKLLALKDAAQDSQNPVSQLLLRGKVAYLFERYTDNQEMNALVVCASSFKQSDVSDVGPVLTRWVEKTQGKTAEERGKSKAGLFWAITMCDMRITDNLKKTESQLKEAWEGMLHMTLLERFAQYDWLKEWSPGKPFDNCFLVRKPGIDNPFLTLENEPGQESLKEVAFAERYSDVLDTMGRVFISGNNVQRHVAEPKETWQEMLKLNDGGISRLTEALHGVAHLEFKLQRLREQLLQCRHETGDRCLGYWYEQDGDGQIVKKQAIAKDLWQSLSACSHSLGEMLGRMDLPTHELHNIYLSIRNQDQEPQPAGEQSTQSVFAANPFGGNPFANNPFGSALVEDKPTVVESVSPPERIGRDDEFAHQAFKAWLAHLRDLPQQTMSWQQLGMSSEMINLLCEELITAATRLDLEGKLKHALSGQEQAGTLRHQLKARQVLRAQLTIRDFIAWFGYLSLPEDQVPNSYVGEKKKVFSRQAPLSDDELPQLTSVAPQPGVAYMGDWLSALMTNILDNAGHSATRDISFEHNRQLGQIISQMKQENLSC